MSLDLLNLVIIIILNIAFFFVGITLNSLVILVFWRTTYLRKKLCYFMIFVLSWCDLLLILVNHPFVTILAIFFAIDKFQLFPHCVRITLDIVSLTIAPSLLALLVMNVDRYLSLTYPIYHKANITKRKLLWLLATCILMSSISNILYIDKLVYSLEVHSIIFMTLYVPPMLFTTYKLFKISRKYRKLRHDKPEKRKIVSSKQISICLLGFACQMFFNIPVLIFIVYNLLLPVTRASDIFVLWIKTIVAMNSTFNCLIFFWKNTILRSEAMKIIKRTRKYFLYENHNTIPSSIVKNNEHSHNSYHNSISLS